MTPREEAVARAILKYCDMKDWETVKITESLLGIAQFCIDAVDGKIEVPPAETSQYDIPV